MLRNEWKSLFRNKFLIVVLIAIITIPAIYTTLFLGSMWDPYGKLDQLPVAIVNQDQMVSYHEELVDVGERLVDSLKENDSLAFHFVDEETAREGLANGTFYMVITIPEEFSANAITLLDETPKKMLLTYETNPGTNYIASKMSESALSKIQTKIANQVTAEYATIIFDKLDVIADGFERATDGTIQLLDGESQLLEGNQTITDNLTVLAESSLTFADGSKQLEVGIQTYTNGVVTLADGIHTLANGIDTFATTAGNGTNTLHEGASTLTQGVKKYTDGVHVAYTGAQTLAQNSSALLKGVSSLGDGAAALNAGSTTLVKGMETLSSSLGQSLSDQKKQQMGELQQGITGLNAAIEALNRQVAAMDLGEENAAQLQQLQQTIAKIAGTANVVLPSSNTTIQTLADGLGTVQTVVNGQLIPGASALEQGAASLQAGLTGKEGLQTGLNAYTTGVGALASGLTELDNNSSSLVEGSSTLTAGVSQLADGLAGGLTQLKDGTTKLQDGSSQLVANNLALLSGANQLNDGANKIQEGSALLAEGSATLGEGLNTLYDGTTTLSDSLGEATTEIKDTTAHVNDETIDMFSKPVDAEGHTVTVMENNGHAMAAYMMVVALWVACLGFCKMYPLTKHDGTMKSGTALWLSKASVMYPVTIIWSAVMIYALVKINGFNPTNMGQTMLVAALGGITFITMMYFFNVVFGKVGSYIIFILMVVQLSGATGTYPVELSGDFVAKIHKFLPFSYVVNAFRSTISGGLSIQSDVIVLLSVTVVFALMTIVFFAIQKRVGQEESETEVLELITE